MDRADGDEVVACELEVLDLVSEGRLYLDGLEIDVAGRKLPQRLIVLVAGHAVLGDVALQGTRVDIDARLVDVGDDAVEDLTIEGLEGDNGEAYVEDHVASGVLDNALQVAILEIEVVLDDVDDVAVLLDALANELLVDPVVVMDKTHLLFLKLIDEVLTEVSGLDGDDFMDVFDNDEHN